MLHQQIDERKPLALPVRDLIDDIGLLLVQVRRYERPVRQDGPGEIQASYQIRIDQPDEVLQVLRVREKPDDASVRELTNLPLFLLLDLMVPRFCWSAPIIPCRTGPMRAALAGSATSEYGRNQPSAADAPDEYAE